jgi:intracellular septation protein A
VSSTSDRAAPRKRSGVLANIGFNIVIPTLILTKLSSEEYLGPAWGIVIALAFPVGYGLRDWLQTRRHNFFSILGIVSVVLTGSMSLLQLDPAYIAIKEAAIPGLLGLATLISAYTRWPLAKIFLYNEQVMRVERVKAALERHQAETAFEQRLRNASFMVAASFFLSSVLNYMLARLLLVSPPGTPEYAAELGKMTALSFPVIAVPSTIVLMGAMFYLLSGIRKLTHLTFEEIFQEL